MKSIAEILQSIRSKDVGKYVTHEWQLFGYKLAKNLDDIDRVSMYMRLAKTEKREVLEKALDFVKESKARSKSRLFLWKLKQIRLERKTKDKQK